MDYVNLSYILKSTSSFPKFSIIDGYVYTTIFPVIQPNPNTHKAVENPHPPNKTIF